MDTGFKIEDVDCCDFLPDDRQEQLKYKYYCPICLRYFTFILQSECCQNYLCLLCVNDLQEQEQRDEKFKAVCPYGCSHTNKAAEDPAAGEAKFKLRDVDPEKKIKKYSDSQAMMSAYSKRLEDGGQAVEEDDQAEDLGREGQGEDGNSEVEEGSNGQPVAGAGEESA